MSGTSKLLTGYFFCVFLFSSFTSAKAGLNIFTNLVFVDEWLIESKLDSSTGEIKCRASIPFHANWFGARLRLGPSNELIKPLWISINGDLLLDSKLNKVKNVLNDCRSGHLFLLEK